MKELQKIKEAVWRANPDNWINGLKKCDNPTSCPPPARKMCKGHDNEIRLADVLLAIRKKGVYVEELDEEGKFTGQKINIYMHIFSEILSKWNLKENLDWHATNRPEVIKFLAEIL